MSTNTIRADRLALRGHAIKQLSRWLVQWLGRHELMVPVSLALAAGGIWAFVEIADEIADADAHRIDRAIMLAMRSPGDPSDPIGPRWFEELARDVTALGGAAILILLTVGIVGYLLLHRDRWTAAIIAIATLGAQGASALLKLAFDRPRPDLVPAFAHVYTASFPSGHSMLSAAVYLTFATQLARIQPDLLVRGYLIATALVIVLAVGVSRVYLGVHWPSDVLAGWCAGAAWALLVWAGARIVMRRRDVPNAVR